MKKTLKILFVMIMMITLVGCGNSNNGGTTGDESLDTLLQKFDKTAQISATTLYDEKNVKIELTDLAFNDNDVTLNFKFTNNTSEELEFISGSTGYSVNAINGYMINDGYINKEVAPGETEEDTMNFDLKNIIANGIMKIADISVGFAIDASDYNSNFTKFYTGAINFKTSLADSYDYSEKSYQNFMKKGFEKAFDAKVLYFSDNQLFNNSGIEVNSLAIIEKDNEKLAFLEVKNNNSNEINTWAKEVYFNDELVKNTSAWLETINKDNTVIAVFNLSDILEDYNGNGDLSHLSKLKFTLAAGTSSNIADTTDEIEIDLSKENIAIK